jgi:uroporphyrinogen-III synthase
MTAAPRVLNPRPADAAAGLSDALRAAGLEPVAAPVQRFAPPVEEDRWLLDDALVRLARGEYGLLVVTSPRTVRTPHPTGTAASEHPTLGRLLARAADDARERGTALLVASVGETTTAALADAGIAVDIEAPADDRSAAGLVAEIARRLADGLVVEPAAALTPGSSAAEPTLAEGLLDLGLLTDRAVAYVPEPLPLPADVAADLRAGRLAAAVLTSSATARLVLAESPPPSCRLVAIGAPTARTVERAGHRVAAVAEQATDAALAAAVVRALAPAPAPEENRQP